MPLEERTYFNRFTLKPEQQLSALNKTLLWYARLTLRPARSPIRQATLYIEGSDSFVAAAAASIATVERPVPGRDLHPLKSSVFSRRTFSNYLIKGNFCQKTATRRIQEAAIKTYGECTAPLLDSPDPQRAPHAPELPGEGRSCFSSELRTQLDYRTHFPSAVMQPTQICARVSHSD
jgi:hypothetical protein